MEQQILNELISIKYLLIVILVIGIIPISLILIMRTLGFKFRNTTKSQSFQIMAEQFFEDSDYHELVSFCQSEIDKRPNSAMAHWYLGRAYFSLNELSKAQGSFLKVMEINPGWEDKHIKPYMDKIENKY